MVDNFQYSYLIGNIFFLFIWLFLFIFRRDLRKEMLIMSFIVAPMGPISEIFYLRDYWRPEIFNGLLIGIEDLLFGFFIGGITAVIYEVFLGKKYSNKHLFAHSKWLFPGGILVIICIMFVGNMVLNFNSIYISIFSFLVIGFFMIFIRRDILKESIYSGLLVCGLIFIFYIIFGYIFNGVIQKWWVLKNISGILIFGVPIEELMWGFGWGFVASPAYTFINGLRLKDK